MYSYCCTVSSSAAAAGVSALANGVFAFAGVPYRQLLVSLLQLTTPLLLSSLTLLVSFLFLVEFAVVYDVPAAAKVLFLVSLLLLTSQFRNTHKNLQIYLLGPLLIAFLSVSWLVKKVCGGVENP